MRISNEWKNYECLDAGNGEKLERWGNVSKFFQIDFLLNP